MKDETTNVGQTDPNSKANVGGKADHIIKVCCLVVKPGQKEIDINGSGQKEIDIKITDKKGSKENYMIIELKEGNIPNKTDKTATRGE